MGITHLSGLEVAGVPTMGMGGAPFFTGNWYFVNPASGSDGNIGSADQPFATVYRAYAAMVSGNNDVCVIVGNGATSGTARMSTALAQTITPAATTGTLTWAKNACHLIGMTAPTGISNRARFAPPTGTYTAATFGNSGNMFNITAQGCYFANFSVFNGFSTGAAGQIAWIEAGGRNFYYCVDIQGMADAASANSTTSASLEISGTTAENTFMLCTFGTDTVQRTAANASLLFAGGTPRNKFIECDFPILTNTAGAVAINAPTGSIDRIQKFDRCCVLNAIGSSSTALTGAVKMGATGGGPNGTIFLKDFSAIGVTNLCVDATTAALVYVDGGAPSAANSGVSVVSSNHP